ncbi:MAG: TonB-dependent receptor [Flavobacteriales bacterium]|jgi:hemoglobin/transferrin/lactoferrin receptor protein|nr:TonB-dependent receptor [Flavobacteriales bacterium]
MKKIFLLFVLIIGFSAQAQITFVDMDRNPISDVTAILKKNTNSYAISKDNGVLTIPTAWKNQDTVEISHTLYENMTLRVKILRSLRQMTLKEDQNFLQEIVVSANLKEDQQRQRAERVLLINRRQIEKLNPSTSADLLANKRGVNVQKSQAGGGSPNIRGFEANRILLMIDGVRMNNAIYRGGHLQNAITIDPSILANSEVFFGPSSVKYGSDALGGVVHFRTRTPRPDSKVGLNYSHSFFSGSNTMLSHLDIEYSTKKWAFLSSVSVSNFGDIRMGSWRMHGYENWGLVKSYIENGVEVRNPDSLIQKRTAYNQYDVLQKAVYQIDDQQRLIANFQYSTSSQIDRFDQLNDVKGDGSLKFLDWYYGPQKRLLTSLSYQDHTPRKFYDKAEIVGAYQWIKESRHKQKQGSDNREERFEEVNVTSLNASFDKNSFGYGFELIYNDVKSSARRYYPVVDTFASFEQTRYPSAYALQKQAALYVKKEHSFGEKWKANAGLRATYTEVSGRYEFKKKTIQLPSESFVKINRDLNFNTSLIYHPNSSTKIAGIVSTGFHAPNIDDISKFFDKGSNTVIPNFGLKSEYTQNFELNISKDFSKKHLINVDLFYSRLVNPIVKVILKGPPEGFKVAADINNKLASNINHKCAYILGSTFYLSSRWSPKWSTVLDITYTEGAITEAAEGYEKDEKWDVLAHIPPVFGKVEAVFSPNERWSHRFWTQFNFAKNAASYDAADVDNIDESPREEIWTKDGTLIDSRYLGTPAWFTLNYDFKYALNKYFDVQVGVTNLLDAHYKKASSSISEQGFSANVVLRARF